MNRTLFISLIIAVIALAGIIVYFLLSQTFKPATTTTIPQNQFGQTTFPNSGNGNNGQNQVSTSTPPPPNSPTPGMSADPIQLTKGFYTWYLSGLIKDYMFAGTPAFNSEKNNWLTQDFINAWSEIETETQVDPALQTQDFENSWLDAMNISIDAQTATSSVVAITLGNSGSGNVDNLLAHLLFTSAGWRIDSIEPAQ